MMRLHRDLAAAWTNGRWVVVVVFTAGLLAGGLLSWLSGFMPHAGRYQSAAMADLVIRTDTLTGEVMAYAITPKADGGIVRVSLTAETK